MLIYKRDSITISVFIIKHIHIYNFDRSSIILLKISIPDITKTFCIWILIWKDSRNKLNLNKFHARIYFFFLNYWWFLKFQMHISKGFPVFLIFTIHLVVACTKPDTLLLDSSEVKHLQQYYCESQFGKTVTHLSYS